MIAANYASLRVLGQLTARLKADNPDMPPRLYIELTKSLDNNVTTDMDLELWQVAKRIQEDSQACTEFEIASAEELARDFHRGKLPAPVQQVLTDFLDRYGMRELAEIDFGRPRWREQPLSIIRCPAKPSRNCGRKLDAGPGFSAGSTGGPRSRGVLGESGCQDLAYTRSEKSGVLAGPARADPGRYS